METTKKSPRKSAPSAGKERIIKAYKEYVLTQGHKPVSVFRFCLDLGIKEEEFYNSFGSFEGIEKHIWRNFIETTTKRLDGDQSFAGFNAREKVLAFYYTLMEVLKSERSFILLQLEKQRKLEIVPGYMTDFRHRFEELLGRFLLEGKSSGEVANRPYLDKRYPQFFWIHCGSLLLFWKADDSPGFEKTDAYIEKSVNFAFDLISKGTVDSAIDFAKFIYQSKVVR